LSFEHTLTDKSGIIADICAGGSKRNAALKLLYTNEKVKRTIGQFVLRYGGKEHDIQIVFQESIILFDRLIREGRFRAESQWETFLIGIGKNTCRNYIRSQKTWTAIDDDEDTDGGVYAENAADAYFNRKELQELLSDILDELKPICKQVLMLWAECFPMDQIASSLGLGRAANARKRKYRCMKELMQLIKTRPHLGHDLQEAWKTIK
jgi:RNA polymerase sigma factor (sigma-70 family)